MSRPDPWWSRAACRDADPRIFDYQPQPRRDLRYRPDLYREARSLCEACPVKPECLRDTLEGEAPLNTLDDFRAGHTPEQLAALRTQFARKKGRLSA